MTKRLIIMNNENGSHETIFFTDDMCEDSNSMCGPEQTVSFDEIINCDLPDIFPLDYFLRRE